MCSSSTHIVVYSIHAWLILASVEKKECFNSVFDPIYNRLWLDIIDEEKRKLEPAAAN